MYYIRQTPLSSLKRGLGKGLHCHMYPGVLEYELTDNLQRKKKMANLMQVHEFSGLCLDNDVGTRTFTVHAILSV